MNSIQRRAIKDFAFGVVIVALGYAFYEWRAAPSIVLIDNAYVGAFFAAA
jgi:hypothetical protein